MHLSYQKSHCQLFCSNVTHLFCLLWSFLVPFGLVYFGLFLSLLVSLGLFQSFLVSLGLSLVLFGPFWSLLFPFLITWVHLPPIRLLIARLLYFCQHQIPPEIQEQQKGTSFQLQRHLLIHRMMIHHLSKNNTQQNRCSAGGQVQDLFYNRKTIKLLNSHDTIWCLYRNTLEIQL